MAVIPSVEDKKKFVELLAFRAGVEDAQVIDSANLVNDLGLDSLELVELRLELEEAYSIDLEDGELDKVATVEELKEILREKGVVI